MTKVEKLDSLFSKLIRARDGKCLRCGTIHGLECSHTISREDINYRWDFMNAITLCWRCHAWWHREPEKAKAWMQEKFPVFYNYFLEHRYKLAQFKLDLDEVEQMLKSKKKEYNVDINS